MGIRGLTSFVANIPGVWVSLSRKIEETSESSGPVRLVLDGSSLIYELEQLCLVEWKYTDYRNFAQVTRKYLGELQSAGFSLHIVVNGMPKEAKMDFYRSREMEVIQKVSRFISNPSDQAHRGKEVVPKLIFQTFLQVVKDMKIGRTVCDGEAASVITWLARTHNCGIVGMDSDFFVVNNPGYVPLDSLKITPQGVVGRKFNRDKFAEELKMKPSMLPLFAAVVGNDDISDSDLRRLQRHIFKTHPPPPSAGSNYKHALIRSIGAFLGTFGEDQNAALEEIERVLAQPPEAKPAQKWGDEAANDDPSAGPLGEDDIADPANVDYPAEAKRIRAAIAQAAARYAPVTTDPLEAKSGDLLKPACPEDWEGGALPKWIVDGYRKGELDWKVVLLLTRSKFWCHGLLENIFEKPSAYLTSRPLRQLVYAVLFKSDDHVIQEHIRDGLQFGPKDIKLTRRAPGSGEPVPHVSVISTMTAEQRLALFHGIFGISREQATAVAACPPALALPVVLLSWWIRDSATPVPVYDVLAILASLIPLPDNAPEHRKAPHFSRHAAHLCATWTGIVEAGNLLTTSLLVPITLVWAFDSTLIHSLYESLRRSSSKDIHSVLSAVVPSIDTLWMAFAAATHGCRDQLDGRVDLAEDGRIVLTRAVTAVPSAGAASGPRHLHGAHAHAQMLLAQQAGAGGDPAAAAAAAAAAGGAAAGAGAGASGSEGDRKKKDKKANFDASIKKVPANEVKKVKVGSIFNALGGDDDDDEEGSKEEEEVDEEARAREEAEEKAREEARKKEKEAKKKAKEEKAKQGGDSGAAASGKKKKSAAADEVDDLAAQFEAMDKAAKLAAEEKEKKAAAKAEADRLKREAKKAEKKAAQA